MTERRAAASERSGSVGRIPPESDACLVLPRHIQLGVRRGVNYTVAHATWRPRTLAQRQEQRPLPASSSYLSASVSAAVFSAFVST